MKIVASVLLLLLFVSGNSMAGFGTNITIYDGEGPSVEKEDNEVEIGNVLGQVWDLEGAFLNAKTLTLVGGWNFQSGAQDPSRPANHYESGDIFIDVDGKVSYGTAISNRSGDGTLPVENTYGYEFVLDVDWLNETYSIVKLVPASKVYTTTAYFGSNQGANPWLYGSGGEIIKTNLPLTWNYYSNVDVSGTGFLGMNGNNIHNAAVFDLTNFFNLFPGGTEFIMHFTMECGNDNLMARGTNPVPEPATIIISLSTLFGSVGYLRRKKFF